MGKQDVIGIKKVDKFSKGFLNASISSFRSSTMILENEFNTLSKRPDDVYASIGRPIINYKHLRWGVGLSQCAFDRIGHPWFCVVAWNNDTDERSNHQIGNPSDRFQGGKFQRSDMAQSQLLEEKLNRFFKRADTEL
jgi:hypothetical protein